MAKVGAFLVPIGKLLCLHFMDRQLTLATQASTG